LAPLEQIFAERLGSNKLFPEEDLSALLKGVLSALAFLQENGITHGDIHPSTIYFDHNSGSFKLNTAEPF
jgi:serine/threonine protein kinase